MLRGFTGSGLDEQIVPSFSEICGVGRDRVRGDLGRCPALRRFFVEELGRNTEIASLDPGSTIDPMSTIVRSINDVQGSHIVAMGKGGCSVSRVLNRSGTKGCTNNACVVFCLDPDRCREVRDPIAKGMTSR